eukprot:COSAG01_NODE_2597_length_7400_cov_37.453363_2_plen_267_part_00
MLRSRDGGTSGDGAFRHGAEWEPICNMYGSWASGAFRVVPATPANSRAGMWLGVINAGLVHQMVFQLDFTTWQPASGPTGGWLQQIQVPMWGAEVAALAPSLLAPFGSVPPLRVTVLSGKALRPHGVLADGPVVRANAWLEPCARLCAHIVVASFDENSPASFTVRVDGIQGRLPDEGANATRLFDAGYNVTLRKDGTLEDWIGAGTVNIYEVGCHGPRPAVKLQNHATGSPWQPCANRRLTCTNGFVHRDGAQPASPHFGRCGVF